MPGEITFFSTRGGTTSCRPMYVQLQCPPILDRQRRIGWTTIHAWKNACLFTRKLVLPVSSNMAGKSRNPVNRKGMAGASWEVVEHLVGDDITGAWPTPQIWVRQLGSWNSHMESHKIHVPNHQPDNHILESQKHFSHRDDALSYVLGLPHYIW